jgi:hypothetical protein
VIGPSTKYYFNEFLFMRILTYSIIKISWHGKRPVDVFALAAAEKLGKLNTSWQ